MTLDPLNVASYTGAGGVTFLGMTSDSWGIAGVVIGIAIAVLTYATNLYFKIKADRKLE